MFGIWKRRFPFLRKQLRFKLSSNLLVIIACSVLYNIARKNLKARKKSAVAKDRREKKKTGGGPAENDLDKFSNAITEMLLSRRFVYFQLYLFYCQPTQLILSFLIQ
jgi:hypothetical protein